MGKRNLLEYVRRAEAAHTTSEFSNAVMKAFGGRKAKTDVEKLVKSYINNSKVGILIAVPSENDNFVHISYSQWNQDMDMYDKNVMVDVALERLVKFAAKPDTFVPKVPFEIARKLPAFLQRCIRYYKDVAFPKWINEYLSPLDSSPAVQEVVQEVKEACK